MVALFLTKTKDGRTICIKKKIKVAIIQRKDVDWWSKAGNGIIKSELLGKCRKEKWGGGGGNSCYNALVEKVIGAWYKFFYCSINHVYNKN